MINHTHRPLALALLVGCTTPADPNPEVTTGATTTAEPATSATTSPTTTGEPPPTTTTGGEPLTTGTTDPTAVVTTGTGTSTGTSTGDTTDPLTGTGDSGTADTGTTAAPACDDGDVQGCYSGPDGTQDVGNCVGGSSTCSAGAWGPCEQEVVPAPETCDLPGDEDCDGLDPCTGTGELQWSLRAGGQGDDEGVRVGFDGAGNLVVAGRAVGVIDLGGGPLPGAGGSDIFVARYSPGGDHLWSDRFGDADFQGVSAIALAVAPGGDIVLGGDFGGSIDLGGGPLVSSGGDAFVARLDPDGAHLWSDSFANQDAAVLDLALAGDDVLLAGTFVGALDLGGGPLVSAGMLDAFVARFTGAGDHLWSKRYGDADWQLPSGIVADAAGNAYVVGGLRGTLNPGSGPLVSAGLEDVLLFKLDPAGAAVWGRRFGDAGSQTGRAIAVDAADRVTITGEFSGTLDLGGGPLVAGLPRQFLAQFDAAGDHLWSRDLCQLGLGKHGDVAADELGNVLVADSLAGECDLGGGPLVSAGGADNLLAKFSANGTHLWSQRHGDAAAQYGLGVAASPDGRVAATGGFAGTIDLGGGPLVSQSARDMFLAAFGP